MRKFQIFEREKEEKTLPLKAKVAGAFLEQVKSGKEAAEE